MNRTAQPPPLMALLLGLLSPPILAAPPLIVSAAVDALLRVLERVGRPPRRGQRLDAQPPVRRRRRANAGEPTQDEACPGGRFGYIVRQGQ